MKISPKLSKLAWQWRGVLVVTPVILTFVLALRSFGLLQPTELFVYDLLLQLRPAELPDQRIVIVGIDEQDLQTVKSYPLSDRLLAQVLTKIRNQKPRSIGLDIVRDLPVEPGHVELVEVFKTTPNLVGVQTIKAGSGAIAPPPTLQASGQVSAAELIIDNDGIVRRGFWGAELAPNQPILGLGLYTALEYLSGEANVPYGNAIQNPVFFQRHDGGYVNAEDLGDQVLLNYRRAKFQTVSLRDILANKVAPDVFSDRLVLIGVTAISLKDYFSTPFDRNFGTSFSQTAGVEIHAQVASQVLATALDGRGAIAVWSKPGEYIWISAWLLGISILIWQLRNFRRTKEFWLGTFTVLILTTAAIALSGYLSFVQNLWIPTVPPLLGIITTTAAMTAFIYVDRLKASEQNYRLIADELRIAEANYRSIFENAVEGIFQMTRDGQFLSVNPAFAEIFGYCSPAELIDHLQTSKTSLYVSPNCLAELNLRFSETKSDEVSGFEYQAYRQGATKPTIIWIRASVRIVRDGSGNILYYEGIANDYTKAKQAESALKQELAELKIEIDEVKRQQQVSQITQSDFFKDIQAELASFGDDDFQE